MHRTAMHTRTQGIKRWPYRTLKQLDRQKNRIERGETDGELQELGT